jgi:3-oxoacyl-[acyl-carrier protein] reductase
MTHRTAFVTGAAQGLGLAIARALHAEGHRVVLADKATEAVTARAAEIGALAVTLDVRDKASFAAAIAEAETAFGPVDILVNNAARTQARDFFAMEAEEWDDVLATNLRSVVFGCQLVAQGMMARGWGRILNLASIAGQRGGPQVQGAHYATSKAGIIGLTRYLAHQFAPRGVTVNTIAPGTILTEQTALAPPEKVALVVGQIPIGRIGQAEEVGALAAFLVSDRAAFITGTTQDINGGVLMR